MPHFGEEQPVVPTTYTVYQHCLKYYADPSRESGLRRFCSLNASIVVMAAWAAMPRGGRIHFRGAIDLGANPITLTLTKEVKSVYLTGEGRTASILTYTGVGYALTIDTGDAIIGAYDLKLEGFEVDCVVKTGGRSGIELESIGKNTHIMDVSITNADIGLHYLNGAYCTYSWGLYVYNCNIGVLEQSGIHGGISNITFHNPYILSCSNRGLDLSGAGHTNIVMGGEISQCGTAIYLGGAGKIFEIDGIELDSNTVVDIDAHGIDGTDQIRNVNIKNTMFASACPHAIKVHYVKNITIENPYSLSHTTAFLWYLNTVQNILMIDPSYVIDPKLLDAAATMVISRNAGMVIDPKAIGIIVRNGVLNARGDVVYLSGEAIYSSAAPAGNNDVPAVVLYGATTNDNECVIAVKGTAQVNCDVAVNRGDTIVVANGAGAYKMGEPNNAQVDPKKIIGYAIETIGGAGLVWVKLL